MMNYNTEKTIIDLSDVSNMSDLGIKITNILDSNNYSNRELCLNLGNIDLKQSQLLSIKALIEAMQSKLCGIETTSEMTETSAISLGLTVSKPTKTTPQYQSFENTYSEDLSIKDTVRQEPVNTNELSSFEQLKRMNSLNDAEINSEKPQVETESLKEDTREFLSSAEEESDTQELPPTTFTIEDGISAPSSVESALDITFGTTQNISDDDFSDTKENDVIFPQQMFKEELEDYETTETTASGEEGKYILLDTEGITPEGLELIKSNTSDLPTLYLTQTLRSGQTVSYEGNIFLIGDAHPGSEINATGDITVWGILGGIVHAGTKGNTEAKVRALKLNPIQLRIAHLYSRRNDTVNVPYVQKSNEFTPEEARIEREQIVIYKTLRRED